MALELTMLALSALLYQFIWIPVSFAKHEAYGMEYLDSNRKQEDLPPLPAWGGRSRRAQDNLIENFAPFAVVVLALGLVDGFTYYTGIATIVFFVARVAHPIVYLIGLVKLRTLSWLAGILSTLYLYYVLFTSLG
jgi:uncharacterized MAPEG superfamily protein